VEERQGIRRRDRRGRKSKDKKIRQGRKKAGL
jgi:hypothetical protein